MSHLELTGKFTFFCSFSAPRGVVSQMMKDPLSLIEDKTLATEVHQVGYHKQYSSQMSGMRVGIHPGRPRASFPRKISKKNKKISESKLKRS